MRIALLSFDFGEYCIQHANGLLRSGEVMLMLPEQLAKSHLSLLDTRVDFRPFDKPRLRQPLRQWRLIYWIQKQLRQFQPDVIHFQRGHLWLNLALRCFRQYPLVLTVHDPRHHLGDRGSHKTPQWIMDYGCRQATRLIVHGEQLKRIVVEDIGIPAERIDVIPHVAVGTGRHAEHVAEDEKLVLFFGRIWEYKGLDYLISAQPLVNREVPTARFVIAGKGEDFQRYERAMVDPTKFTVHNRWISDDERAELFRQASIVVLPYVEATQSGVVPVAYTHGKPVVATTTGGLPEVVDHGITGLLVPPRDEVSLAAAIVQLLGNRDLRQRMGAAGRRKLERESAPDVVADATAEVYRQAIRDYGTSANRRGPEPPCSRKEWPQPTAYNSRTQKVEKVV